MIVPKQGRSLGAISAVVNGGATAAFVAFMEYFS